MRYQLRKIIVYGFESKPAVDTLLRLQQEEIIKIVKWYYDEDLADARLLNCSVACKHTSLWRGDWQQVDAFLNEDASKCILEQMDWLMQEYSRDTEFIREYFGEYKNLMWHLVNEFYRVFSKDTVDCVFFADVPHGNSAATLYVTARALGIKTLYIANIGSFADRFIYAHKVDEYGDFTNALEYQEEAKNVYIREQFEKDLYYMTDDAIEDALKTSWHRKLKFLSSPSSWFRERQKIIVKSLDKYDGFIDFCERKAIYTITKKLRCKEFAKNVRQYTEKNIDLQKKYVYFPLHLQPEMTTDTIGDIYRDQLLAIEKIRRFIPADWHIYVKENPKQNALCRGKYFFKRLRSLPNVSYVTRSFDTYELMKQSQFVATITGTAGYEAITGGKPALIFGRAWYKSLPGVFAYKDDLRVDDILDCKINHAEVEAGVAALLKKTGKGIWRQYDLEHVPNLDLHKNDIDLYKSFYFLFTKCI